MTERLIYGVGFAGVGAYSRGSDVKAYGIWFGMLTRCYTERQPAYYGCKVCDDWLNFQNFAAWYYTQKFALMSDFDLDKDLTIPGNRIYYPDACRLVPSAINNLFVRCITKSDLPTGVTRHGNNFRVQCNLFGLPGRHGTYASIEEAAKIYACVKADVIRQTAVRYAEFLPKEIYDRLINITWQNVHILG